MTEITEADLARFEALAKAADDGRHWEVGARTAAYQCHGIPDWAPSLLGKFEAMSVGRAGGGPQVAIVPLDESSAEICRHIAALHPQAILSLIGLARDGLLLRASAEAARSIDFTTMGAELAKRVGNQALFDRLRREEPNAPRCPSCKEAKAKRRGHVLGCADDCVDHEPHGIEAERVA